MNLTTTCGTNQFCEQVLFMRQRVRVHFHTFIHRNQHRVSSLLYVFVPPLEDSSIHVSTGSLMSGWSKRWSSKTSSHMLSGGGLSFLGTGCSVLNSWTLWFKLLTHPSLWAEAESTLFTLHGFVSVRGSSASSFLMGVIFSSKMLICCVLIRPVLKYIE